ncbi:MAG: hypothetical protein IH918_09505 [Acidobacteria bacterium]|nr:hypothetical protein [Acidobacteriota bacterium]
MDAAPIVNGSSPKVFSSRTRTCSPLIVDRANSRTVALVTVQFSGDAPCMDDPQAATHCCAAAVPGTAVATAVTTRRRVAVATNVIGSVLLTPKSRDDINRVATRAPSTPSATPMTARRIP